jgi:hypothetical protein
MEASIKDRFYELSYYTLGHPDKSYFIHQHIVDAYHAQVADGNTKSVTLTFSLVGLYLFLERNFTGRQVQQAHVKLSQNKKVWPKFDLPSERGKITVSEVLMAASGQERDLLIKEWCTSVWLAFKNSHAMVASLVKIELGV